MKLSAMTHGSQPSYMCTALPCTPAQLPAMVFKRQASDTAAPVSLQPSGLREPCQARTSGARMEESLVVISARVTYAPNSASDTSAALPMA